MPWRISAEGSAGSYGAFGALGYVDYHTQRWNLSTVGGYRRTDGHVRELRGRRIPARRPVHLARLDRQRDPPELPRQRRPGFPARRLRHARPVRIVPRRRGARPGTVLLRRRDRLAQARGAGDGFFGRRERPLRQRRGGGDRLRDHGDLTRPRRDRRGRHRGPAADFRFPVRELFARLPDQRVVPVALHPARGAPVEAVARILPEGGRRIFRRERDRRRHQVEPFAPGGTRVGHRRRPEDQPLVPVRDDADALLGPGREGPVPRPGDRVDPGEKIVRHRRFDLVQQRHADAQAHRRIFTKRQPSPAGHRQRPDPDGIRRDVAVAARRRGKPEARPRVPRPLQRDGPPVARTRTAVPSSR